MLTAEQRIERAMDMVRDLCKPRGSEGSREWIMRIPAEPDYDPDLVIADGLRAGEDALADSRRWRWALDNWGEFADMCRYTNRDRVDALVDAEIAKEAKRG